MEQPRRGIVMTKLILKIIADERGATAIEYCFLVVFIALAILAAVSSVAGTNVATWMLIEGKMAAN